MKPLQLCFQVATVSTLVTGVVTLAAPSAHALSIGDILNLTGEARFELQDDPNAILNFDQNLSEVATNYGTPIGRARVGGSSSDIFVPGSIATLKDLNLVRLTPGVNQWTLENSVDSFMTFSDTDIFFDLQSFVLNRLPNVGSIPRWEAFYTGRFIDPGDNNLPGEGVFTTQGRFTSTRGTTFSTTVEAVPTPALLPGIIGMGLAALRRKSDQTEEETA